MSESRVRENCTHGLMRGGWQHPFTLCQINPHFLYNTLESVKEMAQYGNMQPVCDTAQSLGVMLRYGIQRAEMSTLGDELTQIGHYFQIQLTRFSHRFVVVYEVEPGFSGFPVPRMVLQPLVENAIIHELETTA